MPGRGQVSATRRAPITRIPDFRTEDATRVEAADADLSRLRVNQQWLQERAGIDRMAELGAPKTATGFNSR